MSIELKNNINDHDNTNLNRVPIKNWVCNEIDKYELLDLVGRGTFGIVHKAKIKNEDKSNSILYAIKEILMDKEKEGFPITALREIMILKRLKHKNIIDLIEIVVNSKRGAFLVFDYMDHDLSGLIKRKINFSVPIIKYILYNTLEGLSYLHSNNIIHRDLKSSNILVNNKGEIKIADFGLARSFNPNLKKNFTNRVVTLWYRSPELLLGSREYDEAVDIWALGCVFSELLKGGVPFHAAREYDQLQSIFERCGTPNEETWPGVSKLPLYSQAKQLKQYTWDLRKYYIDNPKVDILGFDLLKKMFELDPSKRIKVKEAMNHEYFLSSPKMIKQDEFPKVEIESHDYQVYKNYQLQKHLNNQANHIKEIDNQYIKPNLIKKDYVQGSQLLNKKRGNEV